MRADCVTVAVTVDDRYGRHIQSCELVSIPKKSTHIDPVMYTQRHTQTHTHIGAHEFMLTNTCFRCVNTQTQPSTTHNVHNVHIKTHTHTQYRQNTLVSTAIYTHMCLCMLGETSPERHDRKRNS